MVEMMLQIPCRADAQRAADALARSGVAQVLLFGSLARDEAGEGSDIDLVAVFDDLDYAQRRSRRMELARLACAASGHRVDLHVTDRPEWRIRTEQVLTSFERRIAAHAVPLTDTPPDGVSWEKEIGLPRSDVDEAAARLKDTLRSLIALGGELAPYRSEILSLDEARYDGRFADAESLAVAALTMLRRDPHAKPYEIEDQELAVETVRFTRSLSPAAQSLFDLTLRDIERRRKRGLKWAQAVS